jgi:cell division transport system permease protein
VIRHVAAEGWLLVRSRLLVTVGLALALAIPVSLAGITVTARQWLAPVVDLSDRDSVVAVLLHPRLSASERQGWIARQAAAHDDWRVTEVPPETLAERLGSWFPYLRDVLDREGPEMLPPLVEVTTHDPDEVSALRASPEVLAVGPTSSVNRAVGTVARRFATVLVLIAVALAASAVLLAAVWVHLELHRHAEEIAIMRLMGATEAMVRGPFVLAVTVPGVVAAALSAVATATVVAWLVRVAAPIGVSTPSSLTWVLAAQVVAAVTLPLAAALITLERHANEMEG